MTRYDMECRLRGQKSLLGIAHEKSGSETCCRMQNMRRRKNTNERKKRVKPEARSLNINYKMRGTKMCGRNTSYN